MTREKVIAAIKDAMVDVLAVELEDISEDSSFRNMEAESIDMLDIMYRLQKSVGVKVKPADVMERIRGTIPDDEFLTDDDVVSAKGMEYVVKSMPQLIGSTEVVKASELITYFPVGNLATMCCEMLDANAGVAAAEAS